MSVLCSVNDEYILIKMFVSNSYFFKTRVTFAFQPPIFLLFDHPNAIYSGIYKLGKSRVNMWNKRKKGKRNSEKFDLTYSDTLRELGSFAFDKELCEYNSMVTQNRKIFFSSDLFNQTVDLILDGKLFICKTKI